MEETMFIDTPYLHTEGSAHITVIPLSATGQLIAFAVVLLVVVPLALKFETWMQEMKRR